MSTVWRRTTDPVLSLLTIAEARAQCRIDQPDDDALLSTYIQAATDVAENYLHRGLLTQTWTVGREDWFDELYLPNAAPMQSITSVKYRAADGTLTTLASSYYVTDTIAQPGCLMRAPNATFPALQADRENRIEVAYVVGWTRPVDVPAAIRMGALLLVGHYYANREAVNVGNLVTPLPFSVEALWAPHRVWWREDD